jgi:hypothetical protein
MKAIDEHNKIRLPIAYEPIFLKRATNSNILEICRWLVPVYVVPSQQNGVINRPHVDRYNQGVCGTPIFPISILFRRDRSHSTPSSASVRLQFRTALPKCYQRRILRKHFLPKTSLTLRPSQPSPRPDRSSFCMAYHSGGVNTTDRARRAVNHVYSIPLIRQQIDLPSALGEQFVTDSAQRRLLGYDARTPDSVVEYIASRRR